MVNQILIINSSHFVIAICFCLHTLVPMSTIYCLAFKMKNSLSTAVSIVMIDSSLSQSLPLIRETVTDVPLSRVLCMQAVQSCFIECQQPSLLMSPKIEKRPNIIMICFAATKAKSYEKASTFLIKREVNSFCIDSRKKLFWQPI